MEQILMIEDSPEFQVLVRKTLGSQYEISSAAGVAEATEQMIEKNFDLILLDISLPDGDGFQFCSQLKNSDRTTDIPVILLTGKDASSDKVLGFSLGADDYVVKPFDPSEFRARVEARLNHFRKQKNKGHTLAKGPLLLNFVFQKAFLVQNGRKTELNLTPIEFKLLACFMRHEGKVLTRAQLLEAVLGEQVFVLERTIDKHICSLREKLDPCSSFIGTVFKTGYRFSID